VSVSPNGEGKLILSIEGLYLINDEPVTIEGIQV
jgi:hypothetical protein